MKKSSLMVLSVVILSIFFATGCGTRGFRTNEIARPVGYVQKGKACWYGEKFHGKPTASGEIFDMHKLTAAHRHLPFGTIVKVTNMNNSQSVLVKINDRGPFVSGRIVDLSYGAAKKVDMIQAGVVPCTLEVVKRVK